MAQVNIIARERRALIGLESTFGTTPSGSFPNAMTEMVFQHEEMLVDGVNVEMLDVMDQRTRRQDAIAPVQGLQIATKYTAKSYLKAIPTAAILTGGGTVTDLSHRILLRHLLGSEHAALGTTVATGASATQFDATSAATLKKGTWILVDGEPTLITNIATATVTVSPALSATPSTADVVRNGYNYAPAETHSSSLAIQTAFAGSSAAQYTFNGVHCGFKLSLELGKLASLDIDGTAITFTGPSAQSIATTSVTDDMDAPFAWKDATVMLSTSALDRTTTIVCENLEIDLPNQWQMVREPSGPSTVNSVVNTAGRPRARLAGEAGGGGLTAGVRMSLGVEDDDPDRPVRSENPRKILETPVHHGSVSAHGQDRRAEGELFVGELPPGKGGQFGLVGARVVAAVEDLRRPPHGREAVSHLAHVRLEQADGYGG